MSVPIRSPRISRWTAFLVWSTTLTCLLTVALRHWSGQWSMGLMNPMPSLQVRRSLLDGLQWSIFAESDYMPAGVALLFCLGLRWLPVNNVTRPIVKLLLGVVTLRYAIWRTNSTLSFDSGAAPVFTVVVYGLEVISIASLLAYTLRTIWTSDVRLARSADWYQRIVRLEEYTPSVDVFIPIHDEPEYQVRRMVLGCQAINYANKVIYLLDSSQRETSKLLALELGCEYIARPIDNRARARSFSQVLKYTQGDLIALMNADYVPLNNFLDRTVGFFYRPDIDLVHTPGDHANAWDVKDFVGAGYVVRRKCLESVSRYFPQSCVENYQPILKLLIPRQQRIYLNECLSWGSPKRNFVNEFTQRTRWLWENAPLWSYLSWMQRGLFVRKWIQSLYPGLVLAFLCIPAISLYCGITPLNSTLSAAIKYFLPFWFAMRSVKSWTSKYHVPHFWSDVATVSACIPAIKQLLQPQLSSVAQVSPQIQSTRWWLWSLLCLNLGAVLVSLLTGIDGGRLRSHVELTPHHFWLIYNSLIVAVAIFSEIDPGSRRAIDRFTFELPCRFIVAGEKWPGRTLDLSEQGAKIRILPDGFPVEVLPEVIPIEIGQPQLRVDARVVAASRVKQGRQRQIQIQVAFQKLQLEQERQLIAMLYRAPELGPATQRVGGLDTWISVLLPSRAMG